jgi:phosphatidylserine/phosphatidylglycerophosphate/cardiolipin synthase-like enzyme
VPSGIPCILDDFDAVNAGLGLMHNKFFVIDYRGGTSDQTWVWTGSWNVTDSGTNADMQNAIEIQDQALAGAYTIEFNEMWGSETNIPDPTNSRFGARKLDNTPHIFNINGVPVELYFSPSDGTTSHIIRTLDKAQSSINVAMLTFTRSDIASELNSKKTAGVKVRCILDNNTDTGTQFSFLVAAGIETRLKPSSVSGLFHHKYAVIDAELTTVPQYVITGSHNWSSSAENSNNENTLIIQSNSIANQYLQEFVARYKMVGGSDNIAVNVERSNDQIPQSFSLAQNYPNPFNGTTNFEFRLPAGQAGIANLELVTLKIYDVLGREVATLARGEMSPGVYRIRWNADVPSGVYYCVLRSGQLAAVRPMILMK